MPVEMSKTVSANGASDTGGSNPLSGYTVIKADDIDAACEIAKGCPKVVDGSGSVEVAQVHETSSPRAVASTLACEDPIDDCRNRRVTFGNY